MALRAFTAALYLTTTSAAVTATFGFASSSHAEAVSSPQIAFDIPAGSLQSALAAFGSRTGLQLIYAPDAVAGRQVPRFQGRMSALEALQRLIARTDLRIRQVDAKVIVLERTRAGARADGAATLPGTTGDRDLAAADGEAIPDAYQIVVTGSNIRGEQPVGSHVETLKREDIERAGYRTVAQALQAVPGNFGGVATEQTALSNVDRSGTNATLSTGVNLRGLGAGATLVLVNGRRIAGAGSLGDFADVSTIPLGVVDRIEVLMDGASAIYGSDAVGGVVNVILKKRFTGFETGARFGSVTQGHMREVQAYQTAGANWNSGGFLVSYEFYNRTALLAQDRAFSRSADSRPLGGTDHRYIFSAPGNVLGFDPVTGAVNVAYAIPTGQDGKAIKPSDFQAGARNLEDFQVGTYLTPRQTRHSVYAVATQDIGDAVHLSLEGRYNHRDFLSRSAAYATLIAITGADPWFVSPSGQPYDYIGYAFSKDLGPTRDTGWSDTMGVTGGIDIDLPAKWKLSAYAAYGLSREWHRTDNIANEAILAEATGASPDDPASAYNPAVTGYFNPYGNGNGNSAAVLAAVGSGFLESRLRNSVTTGNIQADGTLLRLPAGEVQLALGANIRREAFTSQNTSFYVTPTPTAGKISDYNRTIKAGFIEARVPLVAPDMHIPAVRRLDVSLALRTERYPSFGSTTNPKFGVSWGLIEGVTLRGTYGTSFRAPNLSQLNASSAVSTTILANKAGGSSLVLQLSGGNPDLRPERARSWTLGGDVTLASVPGLRVGGTLFRTIFDRRIDRPVVSSAISALIDPDLASFVRLVSPATSAADAAYVAGLIAKANGSGGSFPANSIAAVVDARYVNTGTTDVRGFDFTVGYTVEHGANRFDLGANGTYLLAWRQRTTPTSATLDQLNLPGKPVAFKGRFTAGWRGGGFDALLGMNAVSGYHDPVGAKHISAWTTFDARIAWTSPADASWLGGTTIALAAQNLFDRAPPFYDTSAGVGYDPANADATGRFVSLQITRHW